MRFSAIFAAVSAIVMAPIAAAKMLPYPDNFPACGNTCFSNMLGQASNLGCGAAGTTNNAVDGACLCNNIDFTYGIIDCSNAACQNGEAATVIQYGINWCAEKGVIVDGLGATADPSIASSPTATVVATGNGGSQSTATNSDGSPVTTSVETTTVSGADGTTVAGIPVSTTLVLSTVTGTDGVVMTTTLATSTIFSVSDTAALSGTASESGSASTTETVTSGAESTSTEEASAGDTATATVSSMEGNPSSTTESGLGARQTAAPLGIIAAAGLAALMI
ncbi:hypothetical protein GGR50DRAFT_659703 [Xylaria sp. CBS 124048]|nr:hypothetical protein GGR50DRAFT_659703 [Xylaria sp. CBS 124048]